MEVFWKLVKGELRQQLMSDAEGFNVDLMHQGDHKVEQYTNAVTWQIVTAKMSPTAAAYIFLYLRHPFQQHIHECEDGQKILKNCQTTTNCIEIHWCSCMK